MCDKWLAQHVTDELDKSCQQWLMGNVPGLRPCTTVREMDRELALERARYRVTWEDKEKPAKEVASDDKEPAQENPVEAEATQANDDNKMETS